MMKRLCVLSAASVLLVWVASAGPPALSAAPAPGKGGASLPKGHPPMSGSMPGSLPAGHPPMPGANLPPMPPDAKGTLIVQAVQGTRDGPGVGGDTVVVELVHRGRPIKAVEAQLNDHGRATLPDLPVAAGVKPVVRVTHAGVAYQAVGEMMHAGPPPHTVMVVVYEATEKEPGWVVRARHVIVRRTAEGLYVREMIVVENPTDRAWLGRKSDKGQRTILDLPLSIPPDKGKVDFYAGLHRRATQLVKNRLINRQALAPGKSQFVFGYVVPIQDGKATLEILNPADTDQFIMVLPDDGSQVKVAGTDEGEVMQMGRRTMRFYKARSAKAGHKIVAQFSGIPKGPPAAPKPAPADGVSSLPQTIAATGGGVILAGGLGVVCWKWLRPGHKDNQES